MKVVFRILAISIAIIIVVIIFGLYVIGKQNKISLIEKNNKIMFAAEYYITEKMIENRPSELYVDFPDNQVLQIRGNVPNNGYLKISKTGNIEMKYYESGYCVYKKENFNEISIIKSNKKNC